MLDAEVREKVAFRDFFSVSGDEGKPRLYCAPSGWGSPVKASPAEACRDGGTGRRAGFKIRFPKGSGGSIPPPGTMSLLTKST